MLNKLLHIPEMVRDFLFSTFNREFLIFLFFLVLSAGYWLMSVLNDTLEREYTVAVELVDVPSSVVILGETNQSIKVTVRDKGYTLATYQYSDRMRSIKVSFTENGANNDKLTISNAELQKKLSNQLFGSTKIIAIKPDHLEYSYNYGLKKRFPVKVSGTIRPADTYYLANLKFDPEYVYVYGSKHMLDSLKAVFTERIDIRNFTDTITRTVKLAKISGTKIVPEKVKMTLYPDILTEADATVPVTPVNVPAGYIMRPFPPTVKVHFVIGASQYNNVDITQFSVVADYNSTLNGTSPECELRLVKAPRVVRNAQLSQAKINYLMEQ